QFGNMAHAPYVYSGYPFSRWFHGLMTGSFSAWEPNMNYVNQVGGVGGNPFGPASNGASGVTHDFCFVTRCDRAQGSEQNYAIFGIRAQNDVNTARIFTGGNSATVTMAYSNVWLGDRRLPAMSSARPVDRGWVDDTASRTHALSNISATDQGLGVYGITLAGAASGNGTLRPSCSGDPYRSPCPASWSTSAFTYQLNEGITALSLRPQDIVDNQGTAQTWTEKADRSAPTLSVSGRLKQFENKGLYDPEYDLNVSASDPFSGIKRLEVFVDGLLKASKDVPCGIGGGCGSTLSYAFRPDNFADGEHTIRVVAVDQVFDVNASSADRHRTVAEWKVVTDRRGDIYTSRQFTDDPGQGGGLIAEEWAKFQTSTARRREEDIISTRTGVTCSRDGSTAARCGEVRDVSRFGEDNAGAGEIFTLYRGATESDPRLQEIGELNQMASDTAGKQPVAQGPLSDVVQAWQNKPPAHGSTYVAYESRHTVDTTTGVDTPEGEEELPGGEQVTVRLWLDENTKLPVREIATISTGEEMSRRYWTYELNRLEDAEVPADFFRTPRPAMVEQDKEVDYRGDDALGPQTEPETGRSYQPYALGKTPIVKGLPYCLATGSVETLREPGTDSITNSSGELAPGPSGAVMQRATAYYNVLPADAVCGGGLGSLSDPSLVVRSTEKESSLAQAWKSAYIEIGEVAQTNPLHTDFLRSGPVPLLPLLNLEGTSTAYVITIDDETSGVYIEKGNTAIVITGAFDKTNVNDIATALEAQ
ncbi:MAG: Ig-like domain-containing protein, partial [Solirubrobacterales bacterium]|nr:Ig-like domain-containing protein [Solirubrobacterales bacterium]